MSSRDLICASEIADSRFCRRSWYLNDRDVGPSLVHVDKKDAGSHYHQQYAQTVKRGTPQLTLFCSHYYLPPAIGFGRTLAEEQLRCFS